MDNQRGFTLIEVLVSMVIFAIGMLALAAMFVTQTRGNMASRGMTAATNLAQQVAERLRSEPFASAELGGGNHTPALPFLPPNPVNEMGSTAGFFSPDYTRSWTVADNTATEKAITITVTWEDSQGGDHSISMGTMRTPP